MTKQGPTDERRRAIGRERRERTRARLLMAAARVIAELGEKKATIDDFIQAAGVARGTFYNYYSTRADLLDDLWAQIGRDPFRQIQATCTDIADPAVRIALQGRLVLSVAIENPTWGWLVYALSVGADTVNDDLMAYPRPDLLAGLNAGRFAFEDLDSASDVIVGALRRALLAVLSEQRRSKYVDGIVFHILASIGIAQEEAQKISRLPIPINRI